MKRLIWISACLAIVFVATSCRKNGSVQMFYPNLGEPFSVEHTDSNMIVSGPRFCDTLSYKDGDYYDGHGHLAFTTTRDTSIVYYTDWEIRMCREIQRRKNNVYESATYVADGDSRQLLIAYGYDDSYKLLYIRRQFFVDFVPDAKVSQMASCQRNESTQILNPSLDEAYRVEHTDSSIIVSGSNFCDTLSYKDGDYYDGHNHLALTTRRDTTIVYPTGNGYGQRYEIRKKKDNVYETVSYLANGCMRQQVIAYGYDDSYKILYLRHLYFVDYVPDAK